MVETDFNDCKENGDIKINCNYEKLGCKGCAFYKKDEYKYVKNYNEFKVGNIRKVTLSGLEGKFLEAFEDEDFVTWEELSNKVFGVNIIRKGKDTEKFMQNIINNLKVIKCRLIKKTGLEIKVRNNIGFKLLDKVYFI